MTKDKMTVKELASELNIPPKDLQQTLQNLSIEAKNVSSPLTLDKVERVREHYSEQKKSSVIVRRRKVAATQDDVAEKEVAKNKKPAQNQEDAPKASPVKDVQEVQDTQDEPVTAPVKEKVKKSPPKEEKPAPVESRIISRPDDAAKIVQSAEKSKEEAPAPLPVKEEEPAKAKEVLSAETAEKPAPDAAATKAKSARPSAPDASAMPEGSSAPTLPARSNDASESNEEKDADSDGKKKRERSKKKRPEMEQPQTPVRIISRPSPEQEEKRRAEASARASHAGHAGQGNRPPRPHGDSGYHDNRGGPRPGGPRPAGAGGDKDGRGGFNQDGRDNRPPRPGGPRPGGPRPAGAPGARPGGGPGARPGGAGGDAGFGVPGALGEQSKKKRNKGRRTVEFQATGGDFGRYGQDDENARRMGSRHKSRRKSKDIRQSSATQPLKAAKRKIRITEAIRVADMAHQMGLKSNEIIKVLFSLGIMATINQSLDFDTATLVAAEFEYEVEKVGFSEDDYLVTTEVDSPESLKPRPPVVTIMGHVDHGKTSLLDAIRKSNVTSGEAGGITQHIGAYHVSTKRGDIVFLDTPGHEAFTEMRARGAQVTDIVILVVAADDGVMEQTREAINHSKAANVPIMVAVNKMDKEGADPDRVLRELAELGLQAESWGGDTVTAMVSAKSRQGLDELLELVALQAEILELTANPDKPARGRIVEAKLDKGRGPVATVLIQEGTLRQGDTFVCGVFSGRVRALFNDQGKKVKEAGPSTPVEVQGFDGVAKSGEEFVCVADEKLARRIAESRAMKQRERALAKESKVTLETFLSRRSSDQEALTLNLVLKADVQGSLEAITEGLHKLSTDKVRINVVHGGAGAISESDILLASASQAIIIGFNIRPTAKIKDVAEQENVDIRFYDIIYKLSDDIKSAMQGMLAPVQREQYLGQAEVRKAISVPKIGVIAGCYVSDGKMARNAPVRLLRDGVVVYTGKISSLKRMKDDAKEVLKGLECGICLENYNDIKENDIIEAFEIVEEAATL